jgi:dihydrofolate synthase/folylpolyglutamate synthase
MTGKEAIRYFADFPAFSPKEIAGGRQKMDLESLRILLLRLGNPQDQLKFVHIGGTNGKGSVSAFLHQILLESHLVCGVFNSPAIDHFTEQMRVGTEEISLEELGKITEKIKKISDEMETEGIRRPSQFESVLAVAFYWFLQRKCELVILEVGLGGRDDATNVIQESELTILTSISRDHTELLGDTLPQIAAVKAGIIKPGGSVLLYPQREGVRKVIAQACERTGAKLFEAKMPKLICKDITKEKYRIKFDLDGEKYRISLLGIYQANNAAMAVQAAKLLQSKGWKIEEDAIRRGLEETKWPGRFEWMSDHPVVLADGSHNEDGVRALAESLNWWFPGHKITFVAGVLADKNYPMMMRQLIPMAEAFYTVMPPNPRALSAEKLAEFLRAEGSIKRIQPCASVSEAIRNARDTKPEILCVLGSLYYVGEARKICEELS